MALARQRADFNMSESNCDSNCDLNMERPPGASAAPGPSPLPVETWLSSGTAVLEADGRVIAANDALGTWLGSSPASLKGQILAKRLGERCPEWEAAFQTFINRDE